MILFLCYVFPPAAVLLIGRPFSSMLNCVLTLFGWVPGVRHALVVYADHKSTKSVKQVTKAINHPDYIDDIEPPMLRQQAVNRLTRKGQTKPVTIIHYNCDNVGINGTKFRAKGDR